MRFLKLLLLAPVLFVGCRSAKAPGQTRQQDPDRVEAIQTMSSAEAEAREQMNKW